MLGPTASRSTARAKEVDEGHPATSEVLGATGFVVARLVAMLLIALCICVAKARLVLGMLWRSLCPNAVSTAMVW